jgi:uncharacterized delta-60 repeat protein
MNCLANTRFLAARRSLVRIVATAFTILGASAYAQHPIPGSLHTTPLPAFAVGVGKIPALDIGGLEDIATGLAIQRDGRIVMSGTCTNGARRDFCLARFDADGVLDKTFDGPIASAPGDGKFLFSIDSTDNRANTLVLQRDEKIVIAGDCGSVPNTDFCIARLNPDGSFDTTFKGPDGTASGAFMLPFPGRDFLLGSAIQADEKIVLVGTCEVSGRQDVCLMRLLPDGSLDKDFDGPTGDGNGRFLVSIGGVYDAATRVIVQPDGNIVVSGWCATGVGSEHRFCLARFKPNGQFDPDFDGPAVGSPGDGRFILPLLTGTTNEAYGFALQPDGMFVVGGFCVNSFPVFCVARLKPDGSFDANFDGPSGTGDGIVLLPLGTSGNSALNAIAVQSDGKLVLAGSCTVAGNRDFCVARLHSDGTLDLDFDGPSGLANGAFSLAIGDNDDRAGGVALQPDGRIVVSGNCGLPGKYDFCVARLNGGAFGAMRCTLDIDGDNEVLAGTDSLIHTRIALGMTGSAVVGGISFPPRAIRTTWDAIRTHLVTQCGMNLPL